MAGLDELSDLLGDQHDDRSDAGRAAAIVRAMLAGGSAARAAAAERLDLAVFELQQGERAEREGRLDDAERRYEAAQRVVAEAVGEDNALHDHVISARAALRRRLIERARAGHRPTPDPGAPTRPPVRCPGCGNEGPPPELGVPCFRCRRCGAVLELDADGRVGRPLGFIFACPCGERHQLPPEPGARLRCPTSGSVHVVPGRSD